MIVIFDNTRIEISIFMNRLNNLNYLAFLIFFGSHQFTSAQTGVISQPQYNVLYAGCANTVQIGRQDTEKNTVLIAEGMDIQMLNAVSETYTFTPRGKDVISLLILNESQSDTLDIIEFRVLPIPDAEIYLGSNKNGESLSNKSNLSISLKLPSYVPVQANMAVEDWSIKLSTDQKEYMGTGSALSAEVIKVIQDAPKNTSLQLYVAYKTNGKGIKRQLVNFTL
jgi:hypothetical protein